MTIWSAIVSFYNSMKTMKHTLLIFYKQPLWNPTPHWVGQLATHRKMPYIELPENDKNVALLVYHWQQKCHSACKRVKDILYLITLLVDNKIKDLSASVFGL